SFMSGAEGESPARFNFLKEEESLLSLLYHLPVGEVSEAPLRGFADTPKPPGPPEEEEEDRAYSQNSTAMPPATAVTSPAVDSYNRTQYCKWPCECPKVTPTCPPGVSLLMDGCDCCKTCARQVGEVCNEADTCDYHKGLYLFTIHTAAQTRLDPSRTTVCCHVNTGCHDMVGTGCEHDGVIYRNGQSFKPSCKYQCVCVNGAIGCVALCTESQPPRVWCQTPRRVKVKGQCCEQWICDEPKRGRKTAPRHAVEALPNPPISFQLTEMQHSSQMSLKTSRRTKSNRRLQQFVAIIYFPHCVDPASPAETRSWHKNCITQTTSWSPCSKTCGRGLSMRISNANEQCELVKESRLCNLRPCEVDITKHIKPGKKCLNIYREEQPSNFTISGCTSKKQYRPKYCGICMDERCCIPYKSKTIDVDFECPNGTGFTWKMMWVQACFCNLSCKNPNDIFAELESYYGYPEVLEAVQHKLKGP
ncbi:hypothetical protein L3Q82_014942, partial [Scortum barcoo]